MKLSRVAAILAVMISFFAAPAFAQISDEDTPENRHLLNICVTEHRMNASKSPAIKAWEDFYRENKTALEEQVRSVTPFTVRFGQYGQIYEAEWETFTDVAVAVCFGRIPENLAARELAESGEFINKAAGMLLTNAKNLLDYGDCYTDANSQIISWGKLEEHNELFEHEKWAETFARHADLQKLVLAALVKEGDLMLAVHRQCKASGAFVMEESIDELTAILNAFIAIEKKFKEKLAI